MALVAAGVFGRRLVRADDVRPRRVDGGVGGGPGSDVRQEAPRRRRHQRRPACTARPKRLAAKRPTWPSAWPAIREAPTRPPRSRRRGPAGRCRSFSIWSKRRCRRTIPASLTPAEYAQVVAYLLKINDVPAGEHELPPDSEALKKIRIEMPRGNNSKGSSKRLRPERGAKSPRESERGWGPASID